MKICTACDAAKPDGEFHRSSHSRDGRHPQCKQCRSAYAKSKRLSNPDAERKVLLRYRYGVDVSWIAKQLKAQQSRCAICRTDNPGPKMWSIDHDHACCSGTRSCGECLRGLLCPRCNMGLGMFRDSVDNLFAAIDYLRMNP